MIAKLLLSGILACALASAQRGGGGMGEGMGEVSGGGGRGGGMDIPSMGSAARPSRLDRMSLALKLNKDQKKSLKTILDDGQKEANPVRDQMAKSRQAIGDAIQGSKSPDEINQLVGSEAVLETQMAQIELKAFADIYKGLDKDQQALTRSVFQMMKGIFSGKNWNTEE
jgi:Spy/CpxP family protein refolding chaperone